MVEVVIDLTVRITLIPRSSKYNMLCLAFKYNLTLVYSTRDRSMPVPKNPVSTRLDRYVESRVCIRPFDDKFAIILLPIP